MTHALDPPTRFNEPAASAPATHVVVTSIDLVMGAIAVILAVGLVAAALLSRDVPTVLVMAFGQIIAYYFGRTARS